jgi:hypothetical protein
MKIMSNVKDWHLVHRVSKTKRGPLFFEGTITAENCPDVSLNSLICWKRINRIAGLSTMG